MKRAAVLIIFAFAVLLSFAYGSYATLSDGIAFRLLREARWALQGGPPARPANAEQLARSTYFELMHGKTDIVFLGDSITRGGEWAERFAPAKVVNRGIGGDTTAGIVARLDAVLALKPSKVFLMAGVNDLANTGVRDEDAIANYRTIIARLQEAGASVVVQSTLHVSKPDLMARANPRIAKFNEELSAHCARVGCAFEDVNKVLAPNGVLLAEYTWDGQHLNGLGYQAWSALVERHISVEPFEAYDAATLSTGRAGGN